MNALTGYRTYIVAGLIALATFAKLLGWIDAETLAAIVALLGAGGLATMRAAVGPPPKDKPPVGPSSLLILFAFGCLGVVDAAPVPERLPPPRAVAQATQDVEGIWMVQGTEKGKEYGGAATIVRIGEVYLVQWIVRGTSSMGIGVRKEDQLAVSWRMGEVMGVTLYRVGKDRLSGSWATYPGDAVAKPEVLTFLKALPSKSED